MKTRILGAFFLGLTALFIPGRGQNLILNGSFETPVVSTGSVTIGIITTTIPGIEDYTAAMGATNTNLTDFSVTNGSVEQINNTGLLGDTLGLISPEQGSQYVVLNGLTRTGLALTSGAPGTLSQTFGTTAGDIYQVSYYFSGVALALVGGQAGLQVTVSGATNSTAPNNGLAAITGGTGYENETFDFTAGAGATTTLSFDEPAGSLVDGDGVALDNVSVTPVPEPRQYAAAALGFLALLALGRFWQRRRPATAVVPA
jgi:MYXO-CTERM domain-containing protein